jgi:flagellar biosynthetic protein FlhB
MVSGIAISIYISGWHVPQAAEPKFNFFNPSALFTSMFSVRAAIKLVISVVQLTFISLIVYYYLRNRMGEIMALRWAWSMDLVTGIMKMIFGVLFRVSIGLVFIGLVDLVYQKWKYIDDLKMTKQEVKDEHRSMEGPPEIMRRIRQKQFEIAMQRMLRMSPRPM